MPIRSANARRFFRRGATLAVVVLCGSCDECGNPKPEPIGVPPLGKVEIMSPTVYTAAGPDRTFQWRALVTTPSGRVIAVDAYPEITIKWSSAKAPTLFPNPSQNPVLVEVPPTPGSVIDDIRLTVTRTVGSDISTVTTTTPGVLRIAAVTPTMDRLRVDYVPDVLPAAVLIDAEIGSLCPENDWAIAVVGIADLGRNLDAGCAPAPELVVFSTGHEIAFRDSNGPFKWSSGVDVEQVSPPLPAFRTVSVVVGTPDNGTLPWASLEIDNAHALFDASRSGIGLQTSSGFVHGRTAGITDIAAACSTAALNGLLLPGGYTIGSPDLFVLFVTDIKDTTGAVEYVYQGLTCQVASDQVGRVVFLSLASYLDTTFAHELGHMFGLMAPRIGFGGGHVEDPAVGDFRQDNLMWNSTEYEIRYRRDRFSVGQVFRMNLDIGSWLNNGGLDPGTVVKRDCQTTTTAGVCPALDKESG